MESRPSATATEVLVVHAALRAFTAFTGAAGVNMLPTTRKIC